jgi:hypothetical protein
MGRRGGGEGGGERERSEDMLHKEKAISYCTRAIYGIQLAFKYKIK